MAHHNINGVRLWVEAEGNGAPLVFVHEFGGDHRSWRGQVDHFRDRFRCATYSARGYPPSEVPKDEDAYGQDIATADLLGVLDALQIERAHLIGLSMGAYTCLRFILAHPDRAETAVIASSGSGSFPNTREGFLLETLALADHILAQNSLDLPGFASSATRLQLKMKSPAAWQEFADHFAEHSPIGSAYTLRRVQAGRPSLYDFEDALGAVETPVLLMIGDEDEPCIDTNIFLKRAIPSSGLAVFPKSGHLINLENPATFNAAVDAFHYSVAANQWPRRDNTTTGTSAYLSQEVS
ncbi:MAG: alpha/beta hydrolase [Alphaproteobacteria bacterium]|nr:alpha/beta hydrolase [Alphaproteobacteria bacterium]